MACVNNNPFEIVRNSNRKRKREIIQKIESPIKSGTTISSSTPKKDVAKNFLENFHRFSQRRKSNTGKENSFNGIMEVKSISELVAETGKQVHSENPYEVIRKPPKKKKKELSDGEDNCFINTALNLEIPDTKLNPFEVKRVSPPKDPNETNANCFVNPGLNIRVQDKVFNPFEIVRTKTIDCQQYGIENAALELPKMLTLGIPFQPNIGCRLDFNKIELTNLTPSKMLADKLTITPVNKRLEVVKSQTKEIVQPRSPLSIINEETILDIGKELDCYQLELENSINEAKLRKTDSNKETLINMLESVKEESKHMESISEIKIKEETNIPEETSKAASNSVINSEKIEHEESSEDLSFDDEIDFKAPAPFVRAYRKPTTSISVPVVPLANAEQPKIEIVNENKSKTKTGQVTSVIRRSIRKLIQKTGNKLSHHDDNQSQKSSELSSDKSHDIFQTIRHSLRRKPNKKELSKTDIQNDVHEIKETILDYTLTEKKVFRFNTDEFSSIERKISLRSSFRKSTKDMKHQVMKSIFKKNVEEYEFTK